MIFGTPTLVTLTGEDEVETMGIAPIIVAAAKGGLKILSRVGKRIGKRIRTRKAKAAARKARLSYVRQQQEAAARQAAQEAEAIRAAEVVKVRKRNQAILIVAGVGAAVLLTQRR